MQKVATLEEYNSVFNNPQARDVFLTVIVANNAQSAEERLSSQKEIVDSLEMQIGDLNRRLRNSEREKAALQKKLDALQPQDATKS